VAQGRALHKKGETRWKKTHSHNDLPNGERQPNKADANKEKPEKTAGTGEKAIENDAPERQGSTESYFTVDVNPPSSAPALEDGLGQVNDKGKEQTNREDQRFKDWLGKRRSFLEKKLLEGNRGDAEEEKEN
jgi:hypothetical protein